MHACAHACTERLNVSNTNTLKINIKLIPSVNDICDRPINGKMFSNHVICLFVCNSYNYNERKDRFIHSPVKLSTRAEIVFSVCQLYIGNSKYSFKHLAYSSFVISYLSSIWILWQFIKETVLVNETGTFFSRAKTITEQMSGMHSNYLFPLSSFKHFFCCCKVCICSRPFPSFFQYFFSQSTHKMLNSM